MIKNILYIFCLSLVALACGQKKSDVTPVQETKQIAEKLGPPLTQEIRDELLMKATNIDVVFFNLPISMNQEEKYSVNKSIMFMELEAPYASQKAPGIGRLSIIDNGEVLRDVDIHYDGTNLYYTIYENNKPTYYSKASESGRHFMANLISQAGGIQ